MCTSATESSEAKSANLSEMTAQKAISSLKFGPFRVAHQVFHLSPNRLSYALVNLKPLLPGHVLVIPTRCVPRLSQLNPSETSDLFLTVKRVSRTIERLFQATSMNIAIQDGVDAGQSVPHVHVHIIPRKSHDLDSQGGSDAIYGMMDGQEGDIGKAFLAMQKYREERSNHRDFVAGPDSDRKPRSEQEMENEATWFREEMGKDEESQSDG